MEERKQELQTQAQSGEQIVDESAFVFADETRVNESQLDEKAFEYEATLTPDALI